MGWSFGFRGFIFLIPYFRASFLIDHAIFVARIQVQARV